MVQQQHRPPLSPKNQNRSSSSSNKPSSFSANNNRGSENNSGRRRSTEARNNNKCDDSHNDNTHSKTTNTTPNKKSNNCQFTMGPTIRAVIIDLSCILYAVDKNRIIMNEMVDAVAALKKHKRLVKFVANTTTRTPTDILKQLNQLGFEDITKEDIITTIVATKSYLKKQKLYHPYCFMMDEKIASELQQQQQQDGPKQQKVNDTNNNTNSTNYNCVVIGTSPSTNMTHKTMDKAFHILQKYPTNLISLSSNDFVGGGRDSNNNHHHMNKDSLLPNSISLGPNIYCKTLETAVNQHNNNNTINNNNTEEYYDFETTPTPCCETTYMDNFSTTFLEQARVHDIPLKETCFIGCGTIHVGISSAREVGFGMTLFVKNIGGGGSGSGSSGSGSGNRGSIGSASVLDDTNNVHQSNENGPSKICISTVEAMNFLLSKERARAKKLMLGRNKKGTAASAGSAAAGIGRPTTTVTAQKV